MGIVDRVGEELKLDLTDKKLRFRLGVMVATLIQESTRKINVVSRSDLGDFLGLVTEGHGSRLGLNVSIREFVKHLFDEEDLGLEFEEVLEEGNPITVKEILDCERIKEMGIDDVHKLDKILDYTFYRAVKDEDRAVLTGLLYGRLPEYKGEAIL